MMTLTQITAETFELTKGRALLATFEADNDCDAMSFVAREYPGVPCTLDVQTYERNVAALYAELVA